MSESTTCFEVPSDPPSRNFRHEYDRLLQNVNAVNHGEFEYAVHEVITQANVVDGEGPDRAKVLAIQRCRRGGKTFMLHAIAALLSVDQRVVCTNTRIIFISLNSNTQYGGTGDETAYNAVLSRVAWELSGQEEGSFDLFLDKYNNNYTAVDKWLTIQGNRVILIVDELNVIPYVAEQYGRMRRLLDEFVQKEGCALLYLTHLRSTADLLRNRVPGYDSSFSLRDHLWLMIPRIVNTDCMYGLRKDSNYQPSFWCAVLRGRVPALVLQDSRTIEDYTSQLVYNESNREEERRKCLAAVITGDIEPLPNARHLFKAYSYMSERYQSATQAPLYAWPVFMVAQGAVLGRNYVQLRSTLENPNISESKAFEVIVQLAVLVRLLSEQEHYLVPSNEEIQAGSAFNATGMFHVGATKETLEEVVQAVHDHFYRSPGVLQVIAVPMWESFPMYDFFILHKKKGAWTVAAGYQCKQGGDYPKTNALATSKVPQSVWVEGKCRTYRRQDLTGQVPRALNRGWIMLGESIQQEFLGISISEALPQEEGNHPIGDFCIAEMSLRRQRESGAS